LLASTGSEIAPFATAASEVALRAEDSGIPCGNYLFFSNIGLELELRRRFGAPADSTLGVDLHAPLPKAVQVGTHFQAKSLDNGLHNFLPGGIEGKTVYDSRLIWIEIGIAAARKIRYEEQTAQLPCVDLFQKAEDHLRELKGYE
jgi:hypothetical protein